jgi:RNA ligase (TIGR02306 family)
MGRKLASIQTIKELKDVENSDNLQVATVLGWQVVVSKKDNFKVGGMIIYIEVDAFLPIKPEFEFLRKNCYRKMHTGEEGFKLRTAKFRGQISQGLVLPLTTLPTTLFDTKIGDDVTLDLGIIQWQQYVPPELYGKMKGTFPSFLIKTDETRVQVLQEMLTKYKGTKCFFSEKIDGTSTTYFVKDGVFGVCGRNIEYQVDDTNT